MEDNHLLVLYSRHILKQEGNHCPYFDYDEKNWRSGRIKADTSERKDIHSRQLTEINSYPNVRRYASNKTEPDISFRCVSF